MNVSQDLSMPGKKLLSFACMTMVLWMPLNGMALEKEIAQMNKAGFDQIGKRLRTEIEANYHELQKNKKLIPGLKGNDISEIVRNYIPSGSSFDDAENILRSAGFVVEPRPDLTVINDRPDRYDVSAVIDSLDRGIAHNVQVIVSLSPKVPGEYGRIYQVSASIFYTSL